MEARLRRRGANLVVRQHAKDISVLKHGSRTYFCMQWNTLLTFKSMTLLNAFSGVLSNGAPHVAPAFANKMSTCWVCFETSPTRRSISDSLEMSAGTDMALPEHGRAFRAAQASSQAAALREVMKTLEQPAWMRLRVRVSPEYKRMADMKRLAPTQHADPNLSSRR